MLSIFNFVNIQLNWKPFFLFYFSVILMFLHPGFMLGFGYQFSLWTGSQREIQLNYSRSLCYFWPAAKILVFFFPSSCLQEEVWLTWDFRGPINCKAFTHVSWEAEQWCSFFLLLDERCHGSRTVDGLQLRAKVEYLYLSLVRPHCSQWELATLGHLENQFNQSLKGACYNSNFLYFHLGFKCF